MSRKTINHFIVARQIHFFVARHRLSVSLLRCVVVQYGRLYTEITKYVKVILINGRQKWFIGNYSQQQCILMSYGFEHWWSIVFDAR